MFPIITKNHIDLSHTNTYKPINHDTMVHGLTTYFFVTIWYSMNHLPSLFAILSRIHLGCN